MVEPVKPDPRDIDLDAPPATTRRKMLREACTELSAVVYYRLHEIRDEGSREHIIRAHDLLRAALVEKEPK
jgi:hypothetical protein